MAKRPRILIVDDELDLRTSVADVLRCLMDVEVEEFARGADAIAAHARHPADAAVIDYRMPEMNGLEATAALRAITPDLGIILFTAFHDSWILEQARSFAVDLIIPKPAQAEELVAAVQHVLGRSATRPVDLSGAGLAGKPAARTPG